MSTLKNLIKNAYKSTLGRNNRLHKSKTVQIIRERREKDEGTKEGLDSKIINIGDVDVAEDHIPFTMPI